MTDIKQSGAVRWSRDADGVVTIVLDDPGRTANMLNRRHYEGLNACLDDLTATLKEPGGLRGVVLTSAKRSFVAGPEFEPGEIPPAEAAATYDLLVPLRDQARRLETLGVPVAAALNGSALGGGFELALACHYRVAPHDPSVLWSLGETGMGILPAGGGTVRVTRMTGIAATVLDIIGPGTVFHPESALAAGLVDELADDVVAAARAWVLSRTERPYVQRWERAGYEIPGGITPPDGITGEVRRRTGESPVRALELVLDVATRSAAAPLDEAFEIETDAFRTLVSAPEFPALSHLFYAMRLLAGTAPGTATAIREFPQLEPSTMAEVFWPANSPLTETTDDAAGHGIPVVIGGVTGSFVQVLLDAGRDPDAMAAAAARLLDEGLKIDPDAADVASVLAAGFPSWMGGVLHYLGRQE